MTSDDLDDDFGDTVLSPIRPRPPIIEVDPDVEDTMPVGAVPRPATGPVKLEPPKLTTAPIELVEPPVAPPVTPVEMLAPPIDPVEPPELVRPPELTRPPELVQPPPRPRHLYQPESVESVEADTADTVIPPAGSGIPDALVESPAQLSRPTSPPPRAGSDIPDVSDNIWSEPLPEKPLPFRLLLDDGTVVPLDQTVYLGRKPSVPRIHPGGIPLLVTMDSPQREVSSTHLELTTVGGAIVATDLRSTNGSVLRSPGGAPRTLVAGASAVVTPGTVIELGDGNTIELLAPDYLGDDDADGALP